MMHVTTKDLMMARGMVRDGGWLLDLGDGTYLATDDAMTVQEMRGPLFLQHSKESRQWDETTMQPPPRVP